MYKVAMIIVLAASLTSCTLLRTPFSAKFSNKFTQEYTMGGTSQRMKVVPTLGSAEAEIADQEYDAEFLDGLDLQTLYPVEAEDESFASRIIKAVDSKPKEYPSVFVQDNQGVARLAQVEDKAILIKHDPRYNFMGRIANSISMTKKAVKIQQLWSDSDRITIAELLK